MEKSIYNHCIINQSKKELTKNEIDCITQYTKRLKESY